MRTKLAVTATALAVLATSTPAAHAAVVRSGCTLVAAAQKTVIGGQDRFTGVLVGYVAFDDIDTYAVRCYVTGNGTRRTTRPRSRLRRRT